MLYSRMNPEQRKALLDNAENYPFRVTFLGKTAILTYEELTYLRENGVDFDVYQEQAEATLREVGMPSATPSPVEESVGCLLVILRLLHGSRG